ncbi:ABC transporter substrate-binding protein [Streptomyces halobius]|uniref:ABC transporter substrate-binding protein n=1 Tax=Streptomyces halobius TaxID=2879846 RepID=A0ABY4M6A8_9ACTN|nr:ABC transporter substrate-binding protein [Streptomyces halobius]UQA93297.1 ABC transporter substrate-binding protein [Streptomyces halobius]
MTDHASSHSRSGRVPTRPACRRRRGAALIAAGVLLPLPVLTGCGDDESGASAASQDIAPAARDRVRTGGTLRWAVDAMPATFNAFQADANATTGRITGAVLPRLFSADVRGRPQRNADYLDAADISAREPRQVVTYKINPKARWSDGRAIGAADFIAQWKALRGKDNAYWTARNAGYDRIAKVTKGADAREVKVTFAKPFADWRSLFTPLYPKSVMGDADAFNERTRKELPVGAGPFAVQKQDSASGSVTLVRNPKWWGAPAKLDTLVLKAVPLEKRRAALAAGSVDVAKIDQGTATKVTGTAKGGEAGSDALPAYTVRRALEPAYTQLALNGSTGPLTDERVRRAVARALDRQALADTVLKPAGLPARPLGNHLLMAGQQGYADHSDALGGQDTEAAKALLADAGWRPSDHPPAVVPPEQVKRRGGAGEAEDASAPGVSGASASASEPGASAASSPAASASVSAQPGSAAPSTSAGASSGAEADDGRNPEERGALRETYRHEVGGTYGYEVDGRPAAAEAPLSFVGAVGSEVQQAALLRQSASFYKDAAAAQKERAGGDTASAAYTNSRQYTQRAAQALGAAEMIETGQAPHLPGAGGNAGSPPDRAAHEREAGPAEAQAAPVPAAEQPAADRAGAADRAPVARKNGKALVLRFVLPDGPGSEQLRAVGGKIATMLGKIGITTSIEKVSDESYFRDHIASGDYDLALYSWPGTPYPATDGRPIYAKPQPAADGSLTVEQNYTRVGSDRIDQLFEQAAAELDEDAARELMAQADARIWAVAGSIPLYQRPELVATKKSLANVGAFGFAVPRFEDIGYRKG